MTFASDFGPKNERPTLTELSVCDRTGNLVRPGGESCAPLQTPCTVTPLASLPGAYGGYQGQHSHRDKYPPKRRLHAMGQYGALAANLQSPFTLQRCSLKTWVLCPCLLLLRIGQ